MPKTYVATPFQFIVVENDAAVNPTFPLTVIDALNKINSQPVGASLLTAISNAVIAPDPTNNFKVKIIRPAATATIGQPGIEGGSRAVAWNELDGRAGGAGCKAACYWNPNIFNTPNGARPAFIGLAHELIHCYHYTNGLAKSSYAEEEQFTVGLAPHAAVPICENTIRAEHGVPARTTY